MEFILEGQAGSKAVFAELAKCFTVRPGKPRTLSRTLFDTFDWRLYAAGQRLEEVREGESVRTEWLETDSGKVLGSMNGPAGRMARDWQPASLAAALARTIKIRALLPLAETDTTRWPADLLDELEKTVVRVSIEIDKTGGTGAKTWKEMPPCVRLSAVRGYHKAFEQAAAALAGMPGLTRAEHSALAQVLSINGRTPLDYSSKINVRLSPGAPCEEAVRKVLARLVEIMAANYDGTVADVDTEFLHDFRVAVRRTRSMLGQMQASIPIATLKQFRPEFDWLGGVTGPTRDLDVYLLKFDDYIAPLDKTVRRDLAPLRKHILRRQHQEQLNLAHAISAKRYQRLITDWEKALCSAWKSGAQSWRGGEPAEAVAGQRILKILKRALRQGKALTDGSPASAVHELRITCKKLRYMMEFFKSLYPPAEIDELTGALKELQDNLGDFQDYEVHRAELYKFAEEMALSKTVRPCTLLAIGQLAESLAGRQRLARADLGRRFAEFAAKKNFARFRDLFKPSERSTSDEGGRNL
jgi:CHAD domain-containing protein